MGMEGVKMPRLVVCYDVETIDKSGQQRLREVAKVCESFGFRVQASVFEFDISVTEMARLISRLEAAIDGSKDKISIYPVAGSGVKRYGLPPDQLPGTSFIA